MKLLTTYYFLPKRGFTLIETLIGVAVFLLIAMSTWQAFGAILEGTKVLRIKSAAINLANEQIEVIHNLPYADVGIVDGLPSGKIPHEQIINHGNGDFKVTTTIRNIDQPFDGTIGGSPNDTSPADNKLVEVQVECNNNCGVPPVVLSTSIAPLSLENTGNNGALFINVFDANGLPVENADVRIERVDGQTLITEDVTSVNGSLQIVDIPPGDEAYSVIVTKDGYSTDKTYPNGAVENPKPDKPHITIVAGSVTQVSFSIDKLSQLTVGTINSSCSVVGNVSFSMTGAKTIGLDTFKYDKTHTTNSSGLITLNNIEWDTYSFELSGGYDLAGSNPIMPIDLAPDTVQQIDLIIRSDTPNALLLNIKDESTDLPVADATVTLTKGSDEFTAITGKGFISQKDWSSGSGQDNFINISQYYSDDSNIDFNGTVGDISLIKIGNDYVTSGELISSTFDVGTTTSFHTLEWLPGSQPVQVGEDSVLFQIATSEVNDETTVWNFVGPDGTSGSYFDTPGQSFSSVHDGDRYLRYKVYLHTDSTNKTPTVSEVSFTFSNGCDPSGQVFFNELSNGDFKLEVEAGGYTTYNQQPFNLKNIPWQNYDIVLTPQ